MYSVNLRLGIGTCRVQIRAVTFVIKKGIGKLIVMLLRLSVDRVGLRYRQKGACLAVSMPSLSVVDVKSDGIEEKALPGKLDSFLPLDGLVSLVGSEVKVSVKVLCDTAAFDSFIKASVLPF